ncbi:MAG: hypothetical protein E7521_03865 [Ruminococcaceae bacterium]|nr:hypothetical protein [Oscillospiraceae bacterium]
MKNFIKKGLLLLLIICILSSACSCGSVCRKHIDNDQNGVCDECFNSVFVYFDFYSIGNLANKTNDREKLTNYFKYAKQNDDNAVLLSNGDMHSSTVDDTTDWLNELQFDATAIGSGDLALGEDFVEDLEDEAKFSLLAINIYDRENDRIADFCKSSTIIKRNGYKIGVIGAFAKSDQEKYNAAYFDDIYFKNGPELTTLVMDECDRLRKKGVDFIVYILNTEARDDSYYDETLSNGYVDLVFEGNTNESYTIKDSNNVYHLQNDQNNSVGICHAEVSFNSVTGVHSVRDVALISDEEYTSDEYIPQEEPDTNTSNDINDSQNNNDSANDDNSSSNSNSTISKPNSSDCKKHKDENNDEICDACKQSVIVYFDFYNINDLHGKLADADSHIGVDELTTYLKNERKDNPNSIFLSSGDMWQGQAESNMTKGLIMTDWMNELDFTAMALGNHEYDWGGEYIEDNQELAEFPFLAINVYDRATNKLVDYCDASVMVESDGLQIGIIGAIGDCYSSIAVDKCDDVYFKVGSELTSLVKSESDRLRKKGADFIVYILHDGYGQTNLGSVQQISSSQISSYYDVSLSDGYIDLVFEGHTHQGYMLKDQHGVYHLQNRGDNKGGISHAEVAINSVTEKATVTEVDLISTYEYSDLNDDPIVENLLQKYDNQISDANKVLGYNSSYRNSEFLEQTVADLYYEAGVKAWGNKYKIVLGGGFIRTRSPYNLPAGDVTYGQLQSLFTFDNQLTLCSIKGRDLKRKFLETNNEDYFICCGDYGNSIKNNIDPTATYYVVVDNYTAYYAPNNLTVVEEYAPDVFARDLLAEYIKNGGYS